MSLCRRCTYQMRILDLVHHADVVKLDVQKLIDRLKRAADRYVVLELDSDGVVDEGFEEAIQNCKLALEL